MMESVKEVSERKGPVPSECRHVFASRRCKAPMNENESDSERDESDCGR